MLGCQFVLVHVTGLHLFFGAIIYTIVLIKSINLYQDLYWSKRYQIKVTVLMIYIYMLRENEFQNYSLSPQGKISNLINYLEAGSYKLYIYRRCINTNHFVF